MTQDWADAKVREIDPEALRRYQALDHQGKRLVNDIGQLVLDTKAHTLAEVRRVVLEVWAERGMTSDVRCDEILKRLESL